MKYIVADSSAIILLCKCGLLEKFCDRFKVVVPPFVTQEIASQELVVNYPDAALIADLLSEKKLAVEKPGKQRIRVPLILHRGEREALLLAFRRKGAVLATDDGKAVKAARYMKIPFIITPKIVVELYRIKTISFQKARASIEKLSRIGRYSPDIIADALTRLMEEKYGKTDEHKNP